MDGGCLPGGCLPLVPEGVCIPACNGAGTPPVDRQTPVKKKPSQTSFAGGKNASSYIIISTSMTTVNKMLILQNFPRLRTN